MNKYFKTNGLVYQPEIRKGRSYAVTWDNGLLICVDRKTQYSNIVYCRFIKLGWWPLIRTVATFKNLESLEGGESEQKENGAAGTDP
jgi:hypothetical protein